jgi:multiple sugar transport system permease protein
MTRGGTAIPLPGRVLLYAALAIAAVLFAGPLVWMAATAVKPETQAASAWMSLLPEPASSTPEHGAQNFHAVWNDPAVRFPLYLRNTLLVAVPAVVGMTLSSAAVAYGLSRVRWRGRGGVFLTVLVTMMIPFPVVMVPLYMLFRSLDAGMESLGILPAFEGLRFMGSLKPLWVPAWFGGAFNIFLLRQFFLGIPRELDEAARLDGCGHWGIFWRVILPLSRPALAVVALYHFIYVWNDFLAPLVFITDRDNFTLALGLQTYQSKAGLTPWNLLMMASLLTVIPVLALFVLTQGALVRGVATSGLKE